jgi:hypothetical protein
MFAAWTPPCIEATIAECEKLARETTDPRKRGSFRKLVVDLRKMLSEKPQKPRKGPRKVSL